jgi:hypothetical protein
MKLPKVLKKRLPLFGRTKRITAALLKELLGDISKLDIESFKLAVKPKLAKSSLKTSRMDAHGFLSTSGEPEHLKQGI